MHFHLALTDLPCMSLGLQRHRESKCAMTETLFLKKSHPNLTLDVVKYYCWVLKANQRMHFSNSFLGSILP